MSTRRLNVLWISPHPHPEAVGHPGPWLLTLSQALARSEAVNLTVLSCYSGCKSEVEEFHRDGIRYIYLKSPNGKVDTLTFYALRIRRMRSYLARHAAEYDLVHVHGTEHQYHASLGPVTAPVVTSIQGIIGEYLPHLLKGMKYGYNTKLEAAKSLADWTLMALYEAVNVRQFRNYMCRTIFDTGYIERMVKDPRIFPIWEMIRQPFFELSLDRPGDKILFVGGTQALKGLREALQALNEIRKTRPMTMLLLGFVDQPCVTRLIRDYNLTHITPDALEIRGFQTVDGIVRAMQESFCLLHPSYVDNSPNSVCEAQVAGLPVVASEVGGLPSLITSGQTGLLAPLDGHELARNVLRLYEDQALWYRISAQSSELARQRHNPETILNQTIHAYQSLVSHDATRSVPV